jgi:ribose 5-phosphate isomerase B
MRPESAPAVAKTKLLIASDHAGYALKEQLLKRLPQVEWVDLGPTDSSRVDYPDYADRLAQRIASDGGQGVLICGSGQGMAIRANRYRGIRAALVWNDDSVKLSRQHNDANVLCLGSRLLDAALSEHLIELFISTKFEGGRHQGRIDKLSLGPKSEC